jgi:hypothetical protein
MRLSKVALGATSALVALIVVTTALGLSFARAKTHSSVPTRYRYAGVVENARGAPAHRIATGDGFRLSFFDALSQGRRSTRYRVCIGRPGQKASHCWRGVARYGFGELNLGFRLPADVPVGPLTALWLVDGRRVAIWPFLYILGD